MERLEQQLGFLVEIDRLKHITRKIKPIGSDRYENDAEHTWHLAMMAMILSEHANEPGLNLLRTLKMLLIHDIVEIDAGDTFAYDAQGYTDKAVREQKAADRLFGLLPEDQRDELMALWHEFEAAETPEARFANAVDRMHPMLLNFHNHGQSWKENGITADRIVARNHVVAYGSEKLWAHSLGQLRKAIDRGDLEPGEGI